MFLTKTHIKLEVLSVFFSILVRASIVVLIIMMYNTGYLILIDETCLLINFLKLISPKVTNVTKESSMHLRNCVKIIFRKDLLVKASDHSEGSAAGVIITEYYTGLVNNQNLKSLFFTV